MSKNILFCSRNDIVKRTVLGGNVDPEKIIPFVKTAQDKYLLLILGTKLFDKMQNDIGAGTLSGQYLTLQNEYIIDTLVHYALVEALPFIAYTFGNGSISRNINAEQGTAPTKNDVDFLLQKELATATSISLATISDYEKGIGNKNQTHMNNIKKYLNL